MKAFLENLIPRVMPEGYTLNVNYFIRPHSGKSDLQKALPKKIRAFAHFPNPVKVLVIHDQDANDCIILKQKLLGLCNGATVPVLVRIACKELENWYLGDLDSVQKVYPESKAATKKNKAKYKNPDKLNGAEEMAMLSANFTKTHAARELGSIIATEGNNSVSFGHFLSGLRQFLA